MKSSEWFDAMSKEIHALESNNTLTLCSHPNSIIPIGCIWVYKIKYHSNGSIERYNASLVTKVNTEIEGIDYHETIAHVAKLVSICLLLSITAIKNWSLLQLNVSTAFLQEDLNEEVYKNVPHSFLRKGEIQIYKLNK